MISEHMPSDDEKKQRAFQRLVNEVNEELALAALSTDRISQSLRDVLSKLMERALDDLEENPSITVSDLQRGLLEVVSPEDLELLSTSLTYASRATDQAANNAYCISWEYHIKDTLGDKLLPVEEMSDEMLNLFNEGGFESLREKDLVYIAIESSCFYALMGS